MTLVLVFAILAALSILATWRRSKHHAWQPPPLEMFVMQTACGMTIGCLFAFAVLAIWP